MKKETQARRKNSAAPLKSQTQNPAVTAAPLPEEFRQRIESAINTIDDQFAEAPGEHEQILLLTIRQDLSPLLDLLEAEPSTVPSPLTGAAPQNPVQDQIPPAQPAPVVAPPGADPFPLGEDPHELTHSRLHIRDVYKLSLTQKYEQGFGNLDCLLSCIEHHPQLTTEINALRMLCEGRAAILELENRHYCAVEGLKSKRGFTDAEIWLQNRLSKENLTLEEFLSVLWHAILMLRNNPETSEFSNVIKGMTEGVKTMRKISTWLGSL